MSVRLTSLNLSKKLAISSVLLFVLGFFPLVYFTAATLERNLTDVLADQQQAAVRFAAMDLEQKMLLRTQSLSDIARSFPVDILRDPEAVDRYLSQRIAVYRLFGHGVVVIDRAGRDIADRPKVAQRAEADYNELDFFKECLSTGQVAIGKPRVGRFTGKPGVAVAAPIKDAADHVQAVLVGIIDITDKSVFDLDNAKIGRTGELILVSRKDGIVIGDTDRDHAMHTAEQLNNRMIQQALASERDQSLIDVDLHGHLSLVSEVRLLQDRWLMLGTLPVAEAFAPIVRMKQQLYTTACMILLLMGALVGYLVHRQLRPLTSATQMLRNVVAGEHPLQALRVDRHDEVGELLLTFNALRDQLAERDVALQASQQRFHNLFMHMTNGFALFEMLFDAQQRAVDYRFLDFNPAYERLTGLSRSAVLGKTVREVLPAAEDYWLLAFGEVVRTGQPATVENYSTALGRWYRVVAYRPGAHQFAIVVEDVTQQKAAEQELTRLAYHDALTGLPNRALFSDRLQIAIAQARRRKISLAVCYMDLDRFKAVNDTYGHEIGDLLLIEVGKRLKTQLRADDSVSRFGGDEFALLLSDVSDITHLDELLTRLLDSVSAPYMLNEVQLSMSTSLGIVVYPEDASDADSLLRHADEALYAAKAGGRNTYRRYIPRPEQQEPPPATPPANAR